MVRISGFVSHYVYKRTTKENFEKPQKISEFSKLSTKSCMYELDDEQSKRKFYYHESNKKKNNIENDDSMSPYTYVRNVV